MIDKENLINRFCSYLAIDTQSDPTSNSTPSTLKQWDLARILETQLIEMELEDVYLDDEGYIMATLPATVDRKVPTIGFIAHYDTSPDFNATHVKPQRIDNYNGKDIDLGRITLSPSEFEELKNYKGQTLITTDGTSLLGADDKAGITEIMEAMQYLKDHPEIEHGTIKVGFTPDEEIGRGAHKFKVDKFAADWAYTMDGSEIGELEYENFNAASAIITITGKSVHPGYAYGKMRNSLYIAQDFINSLPRLETPEHTQDREGFFHLSSVKGNVSETKLEYIIRDHDSGHYEARKDMMLKLATELNERYDEEIVSVVLKDQYKNMREKIEPILYIVDLAEKSMKDIGITPKIKPIRGGTDGSQLSFMGLPCPNIFAGGHNFHGPYEYVPVESMIKATELIIKIAENVTKMNLPNTNS